MPGFGVIKNPLWLSPLSHLLPLMVESGGLVTAWAFTPTALPASRCPCLPGDGGEMVGPNLAEVMQHDGPISASGPSGRGPISLVRISLSYLSCLQRQKGQHVDICTQGVCSSRLHCEGGSPAGHLIHASSAGKLWSREVQRSEVVAYWWQSQSLNPGLRTPTPILSAFSGILHFCRGSRVEKE